MSLKVHLTLLSIEDAIKYVRNVLAKMWIHPFDFNDIQKWKIYIMMRRNHTCFMIPNAHNLLLEVLGLRFWIMRIRNYIHNNL